MSTRDAVYFESDAMRAFVPSGQSDWMLTSTPKKVLVSQNDEAEVLTTGAVCFFWTRIPDVECSSPAFRLRQWSSTGTNM